MSYSFTVCGPTKADVLAKIDAELTKVEASQPMHSNDRQQAYAAAEAFLEIVPPSDGREYQVSIHGSIGWTQHGEGDPNIINGAGVGVSVSLVAKDE
jgi:hypothetical protein